MVRISAETRAALNTGAGAAETPPGKPKAITKAIPDTSPKTALRMSAPLQNIENPPQVNLPLSLRKWAAAMVSKNFLIHPGRYYFAPGHRVNTDRHLASAP
jgi:hypothetical protein